MAFRYLPPEKLERARQLHFESKLRAYKKHIAKQREENPYYKIRQNLNLIRMSNRIGSQTNVLRWSNGETKVGFLRSLTVPKEVAPGNYKFFVNLTYKDTSTTGEDYFMVKSKISYIPTIIQKRLVEILVWVFGTALLFTIYFLVRSRYREKYLEKKEKILEKKEGRLEKEFKKFKKKK